MIASLLYTSFDSLVGTLLIGMDDVGLRFIRFQDNSHPLAIAPEWRRVDSLPGDPVAQLRAYFAGELQVFDLPLAPQGTPFQLEVWAAVEKIPYGQTLSYGALAQQIGRPTAARAVGAANGKNPLPIVIPCHRVVGHNGALVGYGGGLHRKEALLALELQHGSIPVRTK